MADEPRRVTTYCPRCRRAITWARSPLPAERGVEAYRYEVVGWGCSRALTEDEWADLADEASVAFEEREGRG